MHEINSLFNEIKNKLWRIKRYQSSILLKDFVDFYKEYEFCAYLVVDTINAQAYEYLSKILDTPENTKAFVQDFHYMLSHSEEVKAE